MSKSNEDKKARLLKLKKERDKIKADLDRFEKEKRQNEKKILLYEQKNKILYFGHPDKQYLGKYGKWKPNPPQIDLFSAFQNPSFFILVYHGANRIGKTFSLWTLCLTAISGRFPWEPESKGHWIWDLFGWKPPIRIRIMGQDWEKHIKTVLIPRMKELTPESWGVENRKNQNGVEAYWWFPMFGGSQNIPNVQIVSNNTDSSLLEGWEGHLFAADEPIKRENRIACVRGLTDYNGKELYTGSMLNEPWMVTDIIEKTDENGNPDPKVFEIKAKIWDNDGYGLNSQGIDNFLSKLTDEERLMRAEGVSIVKIGSVLSELNRSQHFVDRFSVPSHWLVDVAIDIGPSKGHDILYMATNEMGMRYLIFEDFTINDGVSIADLIIKKKHRFNLRINRIICDPLAKGDKTNVRSTWEKIDRTLYRFGMYLEEACKDKDLGIIEIKNALKTVTGVPSLYIFRDLRKTTRQLSGWMYENDKPSKKDDDQCENLYRLMLLGTEYEEPDHRLDEEILEDYEKERSRNGDKYSGY